MKILFISFITSFAFFPFLCTWLFPFRVFWFTFFRFFLIDLFLFDLFSKISFVLFDILIWQLFLNTFVFQIWIRLVFLIKLFVVVVIIIQVVVLSVLFLLFWFFIHLNFGRSASILFLLSKSNLTLLLKNERLCIIFFRLGFSWLSIFWGLLLLSFCFSCCLILSWFQFGLYFL